MPQLDLLILVQNVYVILISFIFWTFPIIWFCIRRIVEVLYNKLLVCYMLSDIREIFYF
jgi:hypothetical protein